MKLSETTLEILKNFATINQGLVVKKGSLLKTVSINKNIRVEATIKEEFPIDFAIYDLNKTLGLLSLNKANPELVIDEGFLSFAGVGGGKIRQRFSVPNLVYGYEYLDRDITINEFETSFKLTPEIHTWISSVAAILKCPNIVVVSDGEEIKIFAKDMKGVIVDDAYVVVEGITDSKPIEATIKMENYKIIPGGYDVKISRKGIIKFCHQTKQTNYWIGLEKDVSKL